MLPTCSKDPELSLEPLLATVKVLEGGQDSMRCMICLVLGRYFDFTVYGAANDARGITLKYFSPRPASLKR